MKQATFRFKAQRSTHGDVPLKGKRKRARPLKARAPIHLVLKARVNFQKHYIMITNLIHRQAHRFGIHIRDHAICWRHVHLVITIPAREYYVKFIRAVTGLLARKLGAKLWAEIPFTRIANWGREFRILRAYMEQNREETFGLRAYRPRGRKKAPA